MKKPFLLCVLMLAVCVSAASAQQMSKDEKAIRATLDTTAEGWNKGDLNQYLSAYTPEATEMLSTGPAGGVEALEKTMKAGFWKSGRPLQVLRYENIVVRMLGFVMRYVVGSAAVMTWRCRDDANVPRANIERSRSGRHTVASEAV